MGIQEDTGDAGTGGGLYSFVLIPADTSEEIQERQQSFWGQDDSKADGELQSLLTHIKNHYGADRKPFTEQQRQARRQQLMRNVPDGAKGMNADQLNAALDATESLNVVENHALLGNSKDNGFVGVNMYCDDEASFHNAPLNPRASSIADCCGKPLQVRGDAFLARIFDNGDDFKRLDFRLSEVSSTAPWVQEAAVQNKRKREQDTPEALEQRLKRRQSSDASEVAEQLRQQARVQRSNSLKGAALQEVTPADQAKQDGNAALRAGDLQLALQHYSRALELDCRLAAAYNNRALVHLRLSNLADAEQDASYALRLEPKNVKALLRRGTAREGLQQWQDALDDYRHARTLEPVNKDARAKLDQLTVKLKQMKNSGD